MPVPGPTFVGPGPFAVIPVAPVCSVFQGAWIRLQGKAGDAAIFIYMPSLSKAAMSPEMWDLEAEYTVRRVCICAV